MTCAKQTVIATIVAPNGQRWVGTNACTNPQTTCPRGDLPTGQGYELCESVCQQQGHAEVQAMRAAGRFTTSAVMYLEGHTYACLACSAEARRRGIREIVFGPPPAVNHETP